MRYTVFCLLIANFSLNTRLCGQSEDSVKVRVPAPIVYSASAGILAGSFIMLDNAWYDQYERGPFHFFDDGREWLGMDKAGHVFSTYTIGRYGHGVFKWSGMNETTATLLGGGVGFLYTASIEVLDGTSVEWGFSAWDMVANTVGTGLFVGQQLAWGEQRILPKYSAHRTTYAQYRPELLGDGLAEEVFKDYNGQTYWLSYSPFKRKGQNPSLLNKGLLCLSAGYGAEGMLGANDNTAVAAFSDVSRYSSYYLSLDVDLRKIPTRSKLLRTVFDVLNGLKVPFPAIEFTSKGSVKGHGIYF